MWGCGTPLAWQSMNTERPVTAVVSLGSNVQAGGTVHREKRNRRTLQKKWWSKFLVEFHVLLRRARWPSNLRRKFNRGTTGFRSDLMGGRTEDLRFCSKFPDRFYRRFIWYFSPSRAKFPPRLSLKFRVKSWAILLSWRDWIESGVQSLQLLRDVAKKFFV